jgi:hypothetical protein
MTLRGRALACFSTDDEVMFVRGVSVTEVLMVLVEED